MMLVLLLFGGLMTSIGAMFGTVLGVGIYAAIMVVAVVVIVGLGLPLIAVYTSIRKAIDKRNPDLY